ncbi:MAG: alpha/beta fold hydrolase [Halopseudomonas sp.]
MSGTTANINGVNMRWLDQGEGLPVVLIHGMPTSPALWRHVLPRLHGVHCLAFELVGYGDSIADQPRGELYFSDIYAERRLPEALRQDEVLHGECLGGALYWNDFENLAIRHGFLDPRLVEDRPRELADSTIAAKLGNACFFSAIYRLCKLAELEPACED